MRNCRTGSRSSGGRGPLQGRGLARPCRARILRRGLDPLEARLGGGDAVVVLHLVGELHRAAHRALGILRQEYLRRQVRHHRERPSGELRATTDHPDDARGAQLEPCLGRIRRAGRRASRRLLAVIRLGRRPRAADHLERDVLDAGAARTDDKLAPVRDLDRLAVAGRFDRAAVGAVRKQQRRPRGIGRRRHPGIEPGIGDPDRRPEAECRGQPVVQVVAGKQREQGDHQHQQGAQRQRVEAVGPRLRAADLQSIEQAGQPGAMRRPQQ